MDSEENILKQFEYNRVSPSSLILILHPSAESGKAVARKVCKRLKKLNIETVFDMDSIGHPKSKDRDKKQLELSCARIMGMQGGPSLPGVMDPCHFVSKGILGEDYISDEMRAEINRFLMILNRVVLFNHCLHQINPLTKLVKQVLFELDRPWNRTCRIVTADPANANGYPKSLVMSADLIFVFGHDKSPLPSAKAKEVLVGTQLVSLMTPADLTNLLSEHATDRNGVVISKNESRDLTSKLFWTTDIERTRGADKDM